MAQGDLTAVYRASTALTVTALNGAIASSATWVLGWTSGTIDNSTNRDLDHIVSGTFVAESAGVAAGLLILSVYVMKDDSTWPDVFSAGTEGTEGTATIHDVFIRDCAFTTLWSCVNTTTASRKYEMPGRSVRSALGYMPEKYALFFAHSMTAALETAGNGIWIKGYRENVEA